MPEIIMPKMGDAMEEGTILKWLKSKGDEISEGDSIAEIETDKVTIELEAEDAGTLAELMASEGDSVPVGKPIAFLQAEGEEVPSPGGEKAAEEGGVDGGGRAQTATREQPRQDEPRIPRTDGEESRKSASRAGEDKESRPAEGDGAPRGNGHFRASPLVRRLARERNLDLSKIEGSGPAGRIVERDVRDALESGVARIDGGAAGRAAPEGRREASSGAPQAVQPPPHLPEPTRAPGTELVQLSRIQSIIGERMTASKQQVPHFYATVEVRMDEALALRKRFNEQLAGEDIKLSINDFVMKACAMALGRFPNLNSLYTSEGIELHETVNMAMAVALDEGLIAPVIKNCAGKGLAAISREAKDLASRAREGKLKPEDYQGGTFTVSNMGMFGVESFSAIINQPQAGIVAVSSVIRRPEFDENGEVIPVSTMKLTLSADHRTANGAEGARYMAEVKRLLENPVLLLI